MITNIHNTTYVYGTTLKEWGKVISVKDNVAYVVLYPDHIMREFGAYELSAWIQEQVLLAKCVICGDTVANLHMHNNMCHPCG